jgi:hypothetical protein
VGNLEKLFNLVKGQEDKYYDLAIKAMREGNMMGNQICIAQASSYQRTRYTIEDMFQAEEQCKFCNDEHKEIKIDVRTTYAEDNICTDKECKDCGGCSEDNQFFTMQIVNDKLQLTYRHKIGDLIISPISECKGIKFCPECGRSLIKEEELVDGEEKVSDL